VKTLSFHVVVAPNGDRPYVSINAPQSYIDHLDASGEKAEVFQVEVTLPSEKGDTLFGSSIGSPGAVSVVTRIR
jgi:hypothetical protein